MKQVLYSGPTNIWCHGTKFCNRGFVQPCPISFHVPPHSPQKTYALQSYHMYLHFTFSVTKKHPPNYIYELTSPASNIVCAMPKNLFKSRFWYQMATKELLSRDMLLEPNLQFPGCLGFLSATTYFICMQLLSISRCHISSLKPKMSHVMTIKKSTCQVNF